MKNNQNQLSKNITPESTPRLVTYYNNGNIPLSHAIDLPYTTINLAFLFTSVQEPLTLQLGGGLAYTPTEFSPNTLQTIKALQQAGKKVLISFGGGDMGYSTYKQIVGKETELAEKIATFVDNNGLDGVDIDWEDTAAFAGTAGYNGVTFLIKLTNALRHKLPEGAIITHAPQPPYLQKGIYENGNYVEIMQQVGDKIDWLNIQFYNNPPWSGSPDEIVSSYKTFSALDGCSPQKLLVGLPVTQDDAGSGYIDIKTIIQSICTPLEADYPKTFGGFMNWQFSSDVDGEWAKAIGNALHLK